MFRIANPEQSSPKKQVIQLPYKYYLRISRISRKWGIEILSFLEILRFFRCWTQTLLRNRWEERGKC